MPPPVDRIAQLRARLTRLKGGRPPPRDPAAVEGERILSLPAPVRVAYLVAGHAGRFARIAPALRALAPDASAGEVEAVLTRHDSALAASYRRRLGHAPL